MVCVGAVVLYDRGSTSLPWLEPAAPFILIAGLFILFLLSYRKQTAYISKRINAANNP